MSRITREEAAVLACIALIFALLLVPAVDWLRAARDEVGGTVEARSHAPETTGVGTGTDSRGRLVVTTTTTPESFEVVVACDDGRVASARVRPESWARLREGSRARVVFRVGRFRSWVDSVRPE